MGAIVQKLALIAAFIVVGLSPSFIDFQQSPQLRGQALLYYGIGAALLVIGLWDGG